MKKEGIEVATQVATMIRARIKEATGLDASAGISYCEFLTKIASDLNKPNAQAVITPRMGPILSSSKRFPREQTSHRYRCRTSGAWRRNSYKCRASQQRRGAFSGRSIAFHLRHDERAG